MNDILEYFNACYGDTTGVLHIAVGYSPFLRNDRYAFSEFVPSHFSYPDEADRAAREITREATFHDVYVCPYLMWADKRAKGAAVAHVLVHADVDGGLLDAEKVRDLGGFAVGSGTPGHGHAYVRLSESVSASQHRTLCRGLGSYLGAIDSKISDNDLLRPPGTLNHKPTLQGGDPCRVDWVVRP